MSEQLPGPAELDAEISVLIADDQVLVRAGLRAILEGQPGITVCGEAGDGRAAIDLVRLRRPDVVLMDIQMPDIDGLEATRRLVRDAVPEHPVAVLMLTTFDLDAYVYDALRAGASGFLLKDTLPEDLVAAIRVVARGDALIAPGITKRLIEQFARAAPAGDAPAALEELTPREAEVLILVASGLSNGRDRRGARAQPRDREDARQAHPREARPARSRPGGGAGLRGRPGAPGSVGRESDRGASGYPLGVSAGSPCGATTAASGAG